MTGSDHTASRNILDASRIDDLGEAILALTREIWVLTDRQAVLEAVLADHGIAVDRIDAYQPDAALSEKLASRREQLLKNVLVALRAE